MSIKLEESWRQTLEEEFTKNYFVTLTNFIKDEYQKGTVYPHPKQIFSALDSTPLDLVKVVILGQDPYHSEGQANGLAFSVNDGIAIPPSLVNIYKEIEKDTENTPPKSGNLSRWARQGVLLLNATLTVREGLAGSHQRVGWEEFTDAVIQKLSQKRSHLVFLLWGSYAQKKGEFIDPKNHLVLKSAHPSPLSADKGFFGCKHFSLTNAYLIMHDKSPIDW